MQELLRVHHRRSGVGVVAEVVACKTVALPSCHQLLLLPWLLLQLQKVLERIAAFLSSTDYDNMH